MQILVSWDVTLVIELSDNKNKHFAKGSHKKQGLSCGSFATAVYHHNDVIITFINMLWMKLIDTKGTFTLNKSVKTNRMKICFLFNPTVRCCVFEPRPKIALQNI